MTDSNSVDAYANRFGRGLCYSLALFVSHEANLKHVVAETETLAVEGALEFDGSYLSRQEKRQQVIDRIASSRWFSYASGSLQNLEIPENLPTQLQDRLRQLQKKCRSSSLPESAQSQPSIADVSWAIEEAKELIRFIDEFHGVRTVKESESERAKKQPLLVYRDS